MKICQIYFVNLNLHKTNWSCQMTTTILLKESHSNSSFSKLRLDSLNFCTQPFHQAYQTTCLNMPVSVRHIRSMPVIIMYGCQQLNCQHTLEMHASGCIFVTPLMHSSFK